MFIAAYRRIKNAFSYFVDLGGSAEAWKKVIRFLIFDKDSKNENFDMLKFVLKEARDKYQFNWDDLIEDARTKGRKDSVDFLISEKTRFEQ